jgi:Zn-dependent M28 family amino/carboxypeptidase
MDMIATKNTTNRSVLLEGAPLPQPLIDELAAAAGTYTTLTVQTSLHPFNSDHVPFIDTSIPTVLTIEGTDDANHNIHTADDTLDHIGYDLALQIVRMNVAIIASALDEASPCRRSHPTSTGHVPSPAARSVDDQR